MENAITIEVTTLDPLHRRALEDLVGHQLAANQRLIIQVAECTPGSTSDVPSQPRQQQTVAEWTALYEGLTDEQIETIDRVLRTRANLTRSLP